MFVTHDIEEALVLADRIVLMSDKPTRVLETIPVTAPRPRDIDAEPSLRACASASSALFRSLEPGDEP